MNFKLRIGPSEGITMTRFQAVMIALVAIALFLSLAFVSYQGELTRREMFKQGICRSVWGGLNKCN